MHLSQTNLISNTSCAPSISVILFPFVVIVVQLLSHVWLFVTPGTAAHQASLSFAISQSLLKLMFIGDAIQPAHPVVHFSSCHQSSPASGSFPMNQLFESGGQSTGAYPLKGLNVSFPTSRVAVCCEKSWNTGNPLFSYLLDLQHYIPIMQIINRFLYFWRASMAKWKERSLWSCTKPTLLSFVPPWSLMTLGKLINFFEFLFPHI